MIERFFEAFVYYGALFVVIIGIISIISLLIGGPFAAEIFIILSGLALFEFLELSLYEIVWFCIIINLVLFYVKKFFFNTSYVGEWCDESGYYIINIKESNDKIFIETNLFDNFEIEILRNSIRLKSSSNTCIIKKCMNNKLKIILGEQTIIMNRAGQHTIPKKDVTGLTARQIALLGIVLGVIFAVVHAMMEDETNYLLLFESLLANILEYAIYGFGYVFCFSYFVVLAEVIPNIFESVFSITTNVSLLSILIAITLAVAVIGLAFIPGMFIGIKAILDELQQNE